MHSGDECGTTNFLIQVRGPTDASNFDPFRSSQEDSAPAQEDLSGWDESFGPLLPTPNWLS